MKNTPETLKGAGALLGSAVIYASFGLLIREMAKTFGDSAQVCFRFLLAFVLLAIYALLVKRPQKLPRRAVIQSAALGIAFASVVLLFTISVNNTKVLNSVFLLFAGSIISSLIIGTVWLNEKLTSVKIVAIGLSLIGLFMYSGALLALSVGVVTALLAGLLDGVSNAIRKTLKGNDRNTVLLYQFLFGGLFGLLMVLFSDETHIHDVQFLPILAGIIFALLQIGIGNLLLYGFQHFDVNAGTVILATELLFVSLLGWLFLKEVPAPNEMIGGAIIFFASILSAIDLPTLLKRQPRAAAP